MSAAASKSKVNVVLIGATGILGGHIARGFQLPQYAPKVNLTLLVRKDTAEKAGPKKDALDAFVAKGAKLEYGDITTSTEADLTTALKGQDVIISAVGFAQLTDQVRLIPAAKAAGVKWFIPSEFGSDTPVIGEEVGAVVPLLALKEAASTAIKAAGLDCTIIQTGLFSEYSISPFFGVDLVGGTITAPGSFETTSLMTTPLSEIGLLVANVVVTGRGRNQVVKFGEGPYTYEQLAKEIEAASGKQLRRIVKPLSEFEAAIAANPYDYQARFALLFGRAKGVGTSWSESETYQVKNHLETQSFREFLKKTLGGGGGK